MSEFQMHLDTGRDYYAEGNYEAAKAAAEHALQAAQTDDTREAQTLQALCLRKLEYTDEAYALLRTIVNTTPTAEACAEFALMCAERNECDASCRQLANQAVLNDPDLPSAYMALFWCDLTEGQPLSAVKNLKRGILRGAEFAESRAFDIIRNWCQQYFDAGDAHAAYALITEVGDLFNTLDFTILEARVADVCGEARVAVHYYKKALSWLRAGSMRTEVLEAIARLAI